jgi:uncharacterized protein YjcR
MSDMDTVKILIINSGVAPIETFKHEIASVDKQKIKDTILSELNRLGKQTHALIKFKDKFWVADHTQQGKSESKEYIKHEIRYHPYMKELA